ncbi:MAG: phosphoribosylanthranilate isomerase [Candidatus Dormibacteria bacterium]
MRVKVCGITRVADAAVALDAGADAIGMVFHPNSPRRVAPEEALRIAALVGPRADCVGVLVDADLPHLRELVERFHLSAVQLHLRSCPLELVAQLEVPVWPFVGVGGATPPWTVRWWPDLPLMLDTLSPAGAGGTGRALDLEVARVVASHRPIWLAGGLGPDNVGLAVSTVRPFGVDASSRLEVRPGVKDHGLVTRFVAAARRAAHPPSGDNGARSE